MVLLPLKRCVYSGLLVLVDVSRTNASHRQTTSRTVEQLQSAIDASGRRIDGLGAGQNQHKRVLEAHSFAFESLQEHVDELRAQLKESDVSSMTECMLLHAAQVRQQEITASMLQDAHAAYREVHKHSEAVTRVQEEAEEDRTTFERALCQVQSHVDELGQTMSEIDVAISVDELLQKSEMDRH